MPSSKSLTEVQNSTSYQVVQRHSFVHVRSSWYCSSSTVPHVISSNSIDVTGREPKNINDILAIPVPSVDPFCPLTFPFSLSFITTVHEKWILTTCYTPGYFNIILCLTISDFIATTCYFFILFLGNLTYFPLCKKTISLQEPWRTGKLAMLVFHCTSLTFLLIGRVCT